MDSDLQRQFTREDLAEFWRNVRWIPLLFVIGWVEFHGLTEATQWYWIAIYSWNTFFFWGAVITRLWRANKMIMTGKYDAGDRFIW